MKDLKHLKRFNESDGGRPDRSIVSSTSEIPKTILNKDYSSEKSPQNTQKDNIFLLAFFDDWGSVRYELVYADSYEIAVSKLKEKYRKIQDIVNCTIL